jgi:hypothetical protein
MEALTQHLYYQALIYNHEQYHFLKTKSPQLYKVIGNTKIGLFGQAPFNGFSS